MVKGQSGHTNAPKPDTARDQVVTLLVDKRKIKTNEQTKHPELHKGETSIIKHVRSFLILI